MGGRKKKQQLLSHFLHVAHKLTFSSFGPLLATVKQAYEELLEEAQTQTHIRMLTGQHRTPNSLHVRRLQERAELLDRDSGLCEDRMALLRDQMALVKEQRACYD